MGKKLLTPSELKVMNILWELDKAFVKEIIDEWREDAKPAYNTISTQIRLLQEKGFVGHESFGRSHRYYPLVTQGEYQKRLMKNVLKNVFAGSVSRMVSALVGDEEISDNELTEIQNMIDDKK